jgi:hypothetical protein
LLFGLKISAHFHVARGSFFSFFLSWIGSW